MSFAERFEAAKKKSQESGSDKNTVTIINIAGKKVRKKSNASSSSDSLFDSSEGTTSSADSSSTKSKGYEEIKKKSGNTERVFYVDMEKDPEHAKMILDENGDMRETNYSNQISPMHDESA